ncbi:hypothetical protein POPTR_012G141550v4 [Populus trichocarpa]|uniref:Uncharacterized protein n=1 Tax=Populus trichocarpa TaxID=3694 RepID=A0ACC0S605_POPTR|nr:hypothetical protein BDE02_12G116900 [Populus trichocarpa]KAI9384991.1 hypothetical protein POPTR_012G141550v4 [Populus trichocarpa]
MFIFFTSLHTISCLCAAQPLLKTCRRWRHIYFELSVFGLHEVQIRGCST